jgi:ABC-type lipoprotein export system ATPase subunit
MIRYHGTPVKILLDKIEITGYRSCLRTVFAPNPNLSVLIGPNGSGKTNVLNAVRLVKRLTQPPERLLGRGRSASAECQIKVWFLVGDKKAILTADLDIDTDDDNEDIVIGFRQKWYLKDFTGESKRYDVPLFLARQYIFRDGEPEEDAEQTSFWYSSYIHEVPNSALEVVAAIARHVVGMRYYGATQFTNPASCPVSIEIENEGPVRRGLRLHAHSKFIFDLYQQWSQKSDSYQQFFEIVGPAGIGLADDINFKEVQTSSLDYTVRSGGKVRERKREKSLVIPQFLVGQHELSPNQLSEGTFKTMTLLFYLITDDSTLLLIEEPEVCVHHGLLTSIIELIKTYSEEKQIVISTHSDYVLDQVEPESVHMVRRSPEGGTEVTRITKAMSARELSALRDFLDKEGNLGEYWRHGSLESSV